MAVRLKKGDITIREVLELSLQVYKKKKVDDKKKRMKLDVVSGRVQFRRGLKYDRSKKEWVQSSREVLLLFAVKSRPISYKRTDTIATHIYPVYFLIRSWDKGLDSSFRWRTSSLMRPHFPKKGMNQKQRTNIANSNLRRGLQMNFFFHLSYWLKKWDLLWGPNWASYAPKVTNPHGEIYLDKTALFVVLKILPRIFSPKISSKILKQSTKNSLRQGNQFIKS